MGAGGKEVTLDVFEWHLKKLLYIIDKLPKEEREKAVLILRNSANHYSNLTSGHPLPPPAPCPPAIYSSLQHANQSLAEIPVSQVAKTFDLMKNATPQATTEKLSLPQQQQHQQQQQDLIASTTAYLIPQPNGIENSESLDNGLRSAENTSVLLAQLAATANNDTTVEDDTITDTSQGIETVGSSEKNGITLPLTDNNQQTESSDLNLMANALQDNSDNANLLTNNLQPVINKNIEEAPSTQQIDNNNGESESQAILDEIGKISAGGVGNDDEGSDEVDGPGNVNGGGVPDVGFVNQDDDGEDDWDQHILDGLQDVTSQHSSLSNLSMPLPGMMNDSEASRLLEGDSTHLDVPMSTPQGVGEEMISTENESEEPEPNLRDLVGSTTGLTASSTAGLTDGSAVGLTAAEDISSFILPEDDTIQCKLCFKRVGVFDSVCCPQTCRTCKFQLCGAECSKHHISECKKLDQPDVTSKSSANSQGKKKATKAKKKSPDTEPVPENKTCKSCNKAFTTAFTFKTHMAGHKENDCKECDTKCATKKLLVAHLRNAHFYNTAEKYYNCKFCQRKFVKKPSLWFHYISHTTGLQQVCRKCGEILENEELFNEHMAKHTTNMFSCNQCGDVFARKQQYDDHIKDHNKYTCNNCGNGFPSKKRLQVHKRDEEAAKPETVVISQPKIGIEIKKPKIIKLSKVSETIKKKKKFKCGFCPFQNNNYKKVLTHEKRHKKFRKFVCELCGNAYNSEHNLKEHTVYVHQNQRGFKCNKCEKTFKFRNAMIRHQQVHSEQRRFQCFCGKGYKRQSHLNRHFAATSHGYESKRSIVGGPAYSGSLAPVAFPIPTSETNMVGATNNVTDDINNYVNASSMVTAVTNTSGMVEASMSVNDGNYGLQQQSINNHHDKTKKDGQILMNNPSSMDFYYGGNGSSNLNMLDPRMSKQDAKYPDSLPSMMMTQQHHNIAQPGPSNNSGQIPLPNNPLDVKDGSRRQLFNGDNNYDKLKHYKIPKKYSGVQSSVQNSSRYDPYHQTAVHQDKMNQRMSLQSGNLIQSSSYHDSTENMNNSSSRQQNQYDFGNSNPNDRLPAMLFTEDERDILRAYSSTGGDRMDYSSGAVMLPDKMNSSDYDNSKNNTINSQFQPQKHENRGGYYDKGNNKGYEKMYQDKLYYQDKPYVDKSLQLDDRGGDYYEQRGFIDKLYNDKPHMDRGYADDQRNYYDKSYLSLEASLEAGPSRSTGGNPDHVGSDNTYGADERQLLRDSMQTLDPRLLGAPTTSTSGEFLLSSLECGPADLTVANTSKEAVNTVASGLNAVAASSVSNSMTMPSGRDDFMHNSSAVYSKSLTTLKPRLNPIATNSTVGMTHRGNTNFAGTAGLVRQVAGGGHADSLRTGLNELDDLETFRPSQDLGYSGGTGRQNMYYNEPLDSFNIMINRVNDGPDNTTDKRHKFMRQEKYSRPEDFLSSAGREDSSVPGGVAGALPPLLALNPSLGGPTNEPLSPPNNYMCTPGASNTDNINSQYLSDTGLDYSGAYILP